MNGDLVGLVAVIMTLGIPLGAMYTYYSVRKLRTEERLAAIARGVSVPMEPELSQAARSRRSGKAVPRGRSALQGRVPDPSELWLQPRMPQSASCPLARQQNPLP